MQTLSQHELDCLRRIAQFDSNPSSSCPDHILHRLLLLGLIELAPLLWLPLEMKRDYYRLTPLGHQIIAKWELE